MICRNACHLNGREICFPIPFYGERYWEGKQRNESFYQWMKPSVICEPADASWAPEIISIVSKEIPALVFPTRKRNHWKYAIFTLIPSAIPTLMPWSTTSLTLPPRDNWIVYRAGCREKALLQSCLIQSQILAIRKLILIIDTAQPSWKQTMAILSRAWFYIFIKSA